MIVYTNWNVDYELRWIWMEWEGSYS